MRRSNGHFAAILYRVAALATETTLQREKRRATDLVIAVLHPVLGIGLSRIEAHLAEGGLVVVHFGFDLLLVCLVK
jgi:hypothetical protein